MGFMRAIVSLHQDPKKRRWVMIGLFPLFLASLAYSAGLRVRHWCYRMGILPTRRLGAVVACVGNVTTGGTGKTPAVIHLARRLSGAGMRTAVISRGYGFDVEGDYLVVSDPDGVRRNPGEAPDEALMTARKVPGVGVVVSPSRFRAGTAAVERFGAQVILMDDGFQHLGLFRDIDILAVNAQNPVGNGLVLPAGPLREPASGARRADVVWLSGEGQDELTGRLSEMLRGKPTVRARALPEGLVALSGETLPIAKLGGARVVAFAGIARPERFFETVGRLGATLADRVAFSDHHRYTDRDVDLLNRRADDAGAGLLVTTEKDLARLRSETPFTLPVAALVMGLAVAGDELVMEMILGKVRSKAG